MKNKKNTNNSNKWYEKLYVAIFIVIIIIRLFSFFSVLKKCECGFVPNKMVCNYSYCYGALGNVINEIRTIISLTYNVLSFVMIPYSIIILMFSIKKHNKSYIIFSSIVLILTVLIKILGLVL